MTALSCGGYIRHILNRNHQSFEGGSARQAFDSAMGYLESRQIEVAQHPDEIWWLCERIAALRPRALLEIGSREGGSLFLFAHMMPAGSTIVSIDLPAGPWGRAGSQRSLEGVVADLRTRGWDAHWIRGDSHSESSVHSLRSLLDGRPLDALFVDGDHTYAGVCADWMTYGPLVRPGGLVAFHDLVPPHESSGVEIHRLWAELTRTHAGESCIREWGIGILHV